MNVFTDVYEKAIELLKTPSLDPSWKTMESNLKTLLGEGAPNSSKGKVLNEIRTHLKKVGAGGKALAGAAIADEILKASDVSSIGYQERAALVKTMKHFYMAQAKGSQTVWVMDSPKGYAKWAFDVMAGRPQPEIKTELQKEEEVFGASNRKLMSEALQLARKWSADVQANVAKPSAKTRKLIKRWFHDDSASDDDVDATAATLLTGFKDIHKVCNSSAVIFSDRPHLRASGEWDNVYASVNELDVMPVIYIFQVFIKTGKRNAFGNVPKLWLCALTVVHELSHKLVKTTDIRYDDDGLKPGSAFPPADALKNADSWAYFAADMVGALSSGTIKKVLV
jgi:lysine-specific metallo-endopeptidase family protein